MAADAEALARVEGTSLNETVKQSLIEAVERRRKNPKFKARLAKIIEEDRGCSNASPSDDYRHRRSAIGCNHGSVRTHSPGSLLHEARPRANLSQTDVAHRAHVAQTSSVHSVRTSRAGIRLLERLIAATGIGWRSGSSQRRIHVPVCPTRRSVAASATAPASACDREKYGASNIGVFGSVSRQHTRKRCRHPR